jgi:RNA polymerase sigma factor (sigma-70 family)
MRRARARPGAIDLTDTDAFARFYEHHADGVLRFLARRTFDVEVACDLTAEAFAQALRGRHRFRGATDEDAAAWLYAIVRHLLSRYVRTGVVERKATQRLGLQLPVLSDDDYDRVVQLAGLTDARAAVAEAFGRLREDQQDAVRLRIVDELSYEEIADRLAISESTARARVSRGLRQLAAALDAIPIVKETTT